MIKFASSTFEESWRGDSQFTVRTHPDQVSQLSMLWGGGENLPPWILCVIRSVRPTISMQSTGLPLVRKKSRRPKIQIDTGEIQVLLIIRLLIVVHPPWPWAESTEVQTGSSSGSTKW